MISSHFVSIFKTSARGQGDRHLQHGYHPDDFPGGRHDQDGCAYFARDRWIAELFAHRRLEGYDNFVIEVRIPTPVYESDFAGFERIATYHQGAGLEVVIPRNHLAFLNQFERRAIVVEESEE